ncbi:hypothetical protein J6590_031157 [Homalodisca vitripennis]|nr:hypothetical protein J6590_031157 [Homalodisca vitripennis]
MRKTRVHTDNRHLHCAGQLRVVPVTTADEALLSRLKVVDDSHDLETRSGQCGNTTCSPVSSLARESEQSAECGQGEGKLLQQHHRLQDLVLLSNGTHYTTCSRAGGGGMALCRRSHAPPTCPDLT